VQNQFVKGTNLPDQQLQSEGINTTTADQGGGSTTDGANACENKVGNSTLDQIRDAGGMEKDGGVEDGSQI